LDMGREHPELSYSGLSDPSAVLLRQEPEEQEDEEEENDDNDDDEEDEEDENNEFSGPPSLTHFIPVQDTDRERGGPRALF
jgi:hypothetical protein